MKKFISLALTAAMVASLVPATAFAKTKDGDTINGTVSVVNTWNENKDFNGDVGKRVPTNVPEIQIKVGGVNYRGTGYEKEARFTVRLDNANFFTDAELDDIARGVNTNGGQDKLNALNNSIKVRLSSTGTANGTASTGTYTYAPAGDAALTSLLRSIYRAAVDGETPDGTNNQAGVLAAVAPADIPDTLLHGLKATVDAAIATPPATSLGLTKVTGAQLAAFATSGDGDQITDIPAVSAMSATDVRKEALDIFKSDTDLEADAWATGKYVWADDLGSVYQTNVYLNGKAGWAKSNAAGDAADANATTAVLASDVFAAAKAAATRADYATIAAGLEGDTFSPIDPVDAHFETENDWIDRVLADIKAFTGGNGIYTETFNATPGTGTPSHGYNRKGIVAEIENETLARAVAANGNVRNNEVTITVKNDRSVANHEDDFLQEGDIISMDLISTLENASRNAGVSVTSSDFTLTNDNADFTYVNVDKEALQLSIRKVVDVAEDEVVTLDDKGLVIKSNVGTLNRKNAAADNKITLKISKGFEYATNFTSNKDFAIIPKMNGAPLTWNGNITVDKEEIVLTLDANTDINEIVIYGIDVKAASAKIDKVCTIKATSVGFNASAAVEVAKVVDYVVNLTVDEDEDVPVIYSGVDVDNTGLTDDSDHWSLEVTAKESFPGAWSFRKGFNFELPDHVFVTDVEVVSTENFLKTTTAAEKDAKEVGNDFVFEAFFNAYQNGSHVNFEFDKRVFDDVDAKLTDDPAEMTFRLQLVADTGFEGDVPLKLTGELLDEQEVTIAKFIKPFEVKAEQNDIIIDYRYTDIPTAISITEAEAGLWDKGKATFRFELEKSGETFLAFEDATFEIDSNSGMSIKDDDVKDTQIVFTVDDESDAAATVTMKNIQLFMNRSIPAGPYDLTIGSSLDDAYHKQALFAPDEIESVAAATTDGACERDYRAQLATIRSYNDEDLIKDSYVGNVEDCTHTVKEGFVNVVTAGRDVDDASFTTKVVVPVGENYIVAGEKQIELDTPAYINAAGYTMLPIRAVATALGINNNNVLWDQPTKTVTILYGQRIITMTQGQKVVYVNGSAIPASAAVENTNSRTFLPMRDLATALGVTDIQWDQATRTATLNGNQKGNQ